MAARSIEPLQLWKAHHGNTYRVESVTETTVCVRLRINEARHLVEGAPIVNVPIKEFRRNYSYVGGP
jgi:hypothetical protein